MAARRSVVILLIALPLLSNIISFVIFAPHFASGQPDPAALRSAGHQVGLTIGLLEWVAVAFVWWQLRKEGTGLGQLVNFQPQRLRQYLQLGFIALLPTLLAGWLFARALAKMGALVSPGEMTTSELLTWYLLVPLTAPLVEETIWRGFALPRLRGYWRAILWSSLSFALFHGIFSPTVLLATFLLGLVWGWLYQRTESTLPGMVLHFLSRYLALVPGFA